jgi:hypothetical protein
VSENQELYALVEDAVRDTHRIPIGARDICLKIFFDTEERLSESDVKDAMIDLHNNESVWVCEGWITTPRTEPEPEGDYEMGQVWVDWDRDLVAYPARPAWKDREESSA